jgi:RNA polymerase sigma factor (sigma-70 family)
MASRVRHRIDGTQTGNVTMTDQDWLAKQFEQNREHLRSVAFRMLGSASEADDAVQEGWLRLSKSDTSDVANLGGWLTMVVARVCLDQLRTRASRREEPLDAHAPDLPASAAHTPDPASEIELADSMSSALYIVLQTLAPAERVAFVLHDMFDVPFDDIAPIVGKTAAAARQLASRARRRVQGADENDVSAPNGARSRQREIVAAFLAASRSGDFDALLALLDPDVALRVDAAVLRFGVVSDARGAQNVAKTFAGRAQGAKLALIDGVAGAVWSAGGEPRLAFKFTTELGAIVAIELVGDPEQLGEMDLELLVD